MVLHGESAVALRAAADEAFHEVERLHAQLSLYCPSSEISFINARAAHGPVQVEPRLFALLQLAQRIHEQTNGAFDITIGPLLRCWGFMGGSGKLPNPEQIAKARAQVGMQHILLDEQRRTIRFAREGMMIDLGSIGKGYALEIATETLVEAGIERALVHGGTSTVCALGAPPDTGAWNIAIDAPPLPASQERSGEQASSSGKASPPKRPLAVVALKDEALSVSGVHGKCFSAQGKTYGHVIDPRSGAPAHGALLAAVVLPSATETDAFSTALLLAGVAGHEAVADLRPNMRTLVFDTEPQTGRSLLACRGIAPLP